MARRFQTSSAAETTAAGAELAATLSAGDVVLVSGELGVGKTTLVRGACRALGVRVPVTSPTFTIGQRYPGRVDVSHLDLYRLGGLEDEDPALLADFVGLDVITFVEWPHAGQDALGALGNVAFRVELSHAGGDCRRIEIEDRRG